MSFFANLLGGTLQGVGSGMSAMAADEEKLEAQRALLQDKQQAALELQQQRTADRQWQQQQKQALQMKVAAGGTGGGGVGAGGKGRAGAEGINLARMAYDARTPEEQQRVIALVDSFHGNDAASVLAERMYGTPRMTRTEPTAGDFARHDRAGDMQAAPPTTTLERAQYDADKGVQALQRAYIQFLQPVRPNETGGGTRAREGLQPGDAPDERGDAYPRSRSSGSSVLVADAYPPAPPAQDTSAADMRSLIESNSRSIARLQTQPLHRGEAQASRDEQIRMIQAENQRMQTGGNANPGGGQSESQAAALTPADLPKGLRWIGTSKGQPVYQRSDGSRVVAVKTSNPRTSRTP